MKLRLLLTMLLLGAILTLTACGNGENEQAENTDSTEESATEESSELTLDSKMGEVTIPANPERILAPYHEDALLALGVQPVAQWAIGESVQDYLADQLEGVPKIEWNLPPEQALSHSPDLIILGSGMESYEGSYEDYKQIAPTFVMTEEVTNDWRKQIELFGKILGKEDKAEEVLNDYEQKVEDAKQKLSEAVGDETVAAIWVAGDQFYLFEENRHSANVLYGELGLKVPELVKSLGEAQPTWNPISLEKLSQMKADHVFLLAAEGEPGIETLENSDVWNSTPAVEKGQVYRIEDPSNWTNQGLIASKQTIDDVMENLVQ